MADKATIKSNSSTVNRYTKSGQYLLVWPDFMNMPVALMR